MNDQIVADASLIVDLLVGDQGVTDLRKQVEDKKLNAPTLVSYEVSATLRRLHLGGALTQADVTAALQDFDDMPIRLWPFELNFQISALKLAESVSAYDAAYVVLAEALQVPLWTRYKRLAASHGHHAEIVAV